MATITRTEAIDGLRNKFLTMTDDEHSMCEIATEKGIFCNGFRRLTEPELRAKYWWIVRRRPDMTREELEHLANLWQLAQQDVWQTPLACDVQSKVRDTCRGWDDFTNDQLAKYYEQVVGERVSVV